jgi:hypothetical protein
MGIFSAFIPKRVEKIIWDTEAKPKLLKSLEKRGITPIILKKDTDHE